MSEDISIDFKNARHKVAITTVTGGFNHTRTRINKLARSQDHSFTGTTYTEDIASKCRLFMFDKNFHFISSKESEMDGSYEFNTLYNDGDFYIVCLSLGEECPQISGKLEVTA